MTRQKQPILRRLGTAVLVVALLPLVLPLALFAITSHLCYRALLYMLVWALWLPRGKDILFVYSDSPILARIHGNAGFALSAEACCCSELVGAKKMVAMVAGSCRIPSFRRCWRL